MQFAGVPHIHSASYPRRRPILSPAGEGATDGDVELGGFDRKGAFCGRCG